MRPSSSQERDLKVDYDRAYASWRHQRKIVPEETSQVASNAESKPMPKRPTAVKSAPPQRPTVSPSSLATGHLAPVDGASAGSRVVSTTSQQGVKKVPFAIHSFEIRKRRKVLLDEAFDNVRADVEATADEGPFAQQSSPVAFEDLPKDGDVFTDTQPDLQSDVEGGDTSNRSCTPSPSSSSSSSPRRDEAVGSTESCTALAILPVETFVSDDLSRRVAVQRCVALGEDIPPELLGHAIVPYGQPHLTRLPSPVRRGAATSLRRWTVKRLRHAIEGAQAPGPLALLDQPADCKKGGASFLRPRKRLEQKVTNDADKLQTIRPWTTESSSCPLDELDLVQRLDNEALELRLAALFSPEPEENENDSLEDPSLQARLASLLNEDPIESTIETDPVSSAPDLPSPSGAPSALELESRIATLLNGSVDAIAVGDAVQINWAEKPSHKKQGLVSSSANTCRIQGKGINKAFEFPLDKVDIVETSKAAHGNVKPKFVLKSRYTNKAPTEAVKSREDTKDRFERSLQKAADDEKRPDSQTSFPRSVNFKPGDHPCVIVDTERVLVVYKPPYWTSTTPEKNCRHGQLGAPKIQEWLLDNFSEKIPFLQNDACSNGLCQRLDIQTSGPMIIAKDEKTWHAMRAAVGNYSGTTKVVHKEYYALMHGKLPVSMKRGTMSYPIKTFKKIIYGKVKKWAEVHRKGDPAETHYKTLRYYRSGAKRYTFLSLQIITGRTHQIRVHLAELARKAGLRQCGIVGDYLYLKPRQLTEDRKMCDRVFLHAHSLKFTPPGLQHPLQIKCRLPSDLETALDCLRTDDEADKALKIGRRHRKRSL